MERRSRWAGAMLVQYFGGCDINCDAIATDNRDDDFRSNRPDSSTEYGLAQIEHEKSAVRAFAAEVGFNLVGC